MAAITRFNPDLLLQAEQSHATAFELVDHGQQLGKRTSQTVKAHHGQGVTLSGIGQKLGQARPIHRFARAHVRDRRHLHVSSGPHCGPDP